MTYRTWQTIKVHHCNHIDEDVAMQANIVFPAEWMPEQPPRILAHRCSRGMDCNLNARPSCIWAGTNPGYDPFLEST